MEKCIMIFSCVISSCLSKTASALPNGYWNVIRTVSLFSLLLMWILEYMKEAIFRSFDYVLQPAGKEELQSVLNGR